MTLEYREPSPGSRDDLLEAIATTSGLELAEAMVSAAFYIDDGEWLQARFLELLESPDPGIRAAAATCLGHVARIHRRLDVAVVRPRVEKLLGNPRTAGFAQTALDDIDDFARQPGP